MSVTRIGLGILIGLLCGPLGVHAQAPSGAPGGSDVLPLSPPANPDGSASFLQELPVPPVPPPPLTATGPMATSPYVAGNANPPPEQGPAVYLGPPLSPWLVYARSPCCCGPVGQCGGPMSYEIFFRSGFAFPVGGGIFGDFLHTGWDVEGGGRLLFFNQPATKAWTLTVSVSNIFNRTGDANEPINLYRVPVRTAIEVPGQTNVPGSLRATTPAVVPVPHVVATVSSLNQTFANFGGGREWYLLGTAHPALMQGCNWRIGLDGGGRWGSGMVQFNEINHHTDVIGGLYAAIHTDVEYPWRCGILQAGIRYEYNYIWTSLLQGQNNGDYQSMNLLFQIGMRF